MNCTTCNAEQLRPYRGVKSYLHCVSPRTVALRGARPESEGCERCLQHASGGVTTAVESPSSPRTIRSLVLRKVE